MDVHALVGELQRVGDLGSLARHLCRPERAGDLEALAVLAQGLAGGDGDLVGALEASLREHRELVAAEPVGLGAALHRLGELAAEADQQRVAGRMAERVVVGLEAVEVEDRQDVRRAILVAQHPLDVDEELAAVAEAGEGVLLEQADEAAVLREGQRQPQDDRDQGRDREALEDRRVTRAGEQLEGEDGQREDRRRGEGAPALDVAGDALEGALHLERAQPRSGRRRAARTS